MITWDNEKREKVIRDHRVDFQYVWEVFNDPFAIEIEDLDHSTEDEARYIVIGKTATYGIVSASYTIVEEDYRLITARRAERWMVREYEKRRKRY